jgi:hypothetical protein
MNKEDIITQIKRDAGCDDYEAECIFERALNDGTVKRHLNWNFIISMLIYLSVLATGVWFIWRRV